MASDKICMEAIENSPDELVPLSYVLNDLWPALGLLPPDPENPGSA